MTNLSREKCSDEKPDYLNQLPDALLCHILYFMPTRSAVKTSILSRRWKELWTSVPILDFTDVPDSVRFKCLNAEQDTCFRNFMDKVLACNNVPCIQRFQLDALEGLNVEYVNSWIDAIMRRAIREIHLSVWLQVELPLSLFGCERLVVLKIGGHFLVDVPASLHLPSLEIMYASGLTFVGDGVMKILSSDCPVLRELSMVGCNGLSKLCIYSLSLEKLEIRSMIWGSDGTDKHIDVKSPNIRYLTFEDSRAEYEFGEMSALVEGKLIVSPNAGQLLHLMRKIPNVEKLVLGYSVVECFRHLVDWELPVFLNLTHLEMAAGLYMLQLLTCVPNLVHLTVDVGWALYWAHLPSSETVPSCLLSLPIIEILRFWGFQNNMELVGYLLQNAKALKEMKFHMHDTSTRRARDAYNKLSTLKRASAACRLIFCSSCGKSD